MSLKNIFILALLLRLLLSPFFYHPDIKSQNFHYQFLSQGQLNIYQFIHDNQDHLPYKDTFNYLPVTYFTFGATQSILKFLMPADFSLWLNDWGGTQFNYPNLPYYLLILKIPYIILDLLLGLLLFKITNSKKILFVWLFNPVSFYLIYIVQNFDIVPVFLTILSFYWLKTKPNLSFLVFGLAISFKLYPLIFLPFFLFSTSKNILQLLKYSLIAITPTVLSILPFSSNPAFWQSFFGSGLTQKIIEIKFTNIPIFPTIYLIILLQSFLSKKINIPFLVTLTFLIFICTVNYHSQWLLWFLPFLFLLNNIHLPKVFIPLILINLLALTYIFLINDNFLSWGHLMPIDPEFILISSPYEVITRRLNFNPFIIQNYIKYSISIFSIIFIALYEKSSLNH